MDGHAVGVVCRDAVSDGLEDVAFAVVELLSYKADAGQRVQRAADAARFAMQAVYFEALARVFDGLHIVRHAEMAQSDQQLAVALQQQVVRLIDERQGTRGAAESLGIVLRFIEVFTGPVIDEHLEAVRGHVGRGVEQAVGHLLAIEQVEDGLGSLRAVFAALPVEVAQQPDHLLAKFRGICCYDGIDLG